MRILPTFQKSSLRRTGWRNAASGSQEVGVTWNCRGTDGAGLETFGQFAKTGHELSPDRSQHQQINRAEEHSQSNVTQYRGFLIQQRYQSLRQGWGLDVVEWIGSERKVCHSQPVSALGIKADGG